MNRYKQHRIMLGTALLSVVSTFFAVAAHAAPTVSGVMPVTATAGTAVTLKATYSDDGSPVATCQLYIDSNQVSGNMSLSAGTASKSYTFADEGVYVAFVFCKEASGSFSSGPNTSIDVAAAPPACTSDTWTCGAWGSCSSGGSQTRTCNMTFDCSTVTTPSPATSQACTPPVVTPPPAATPTPTVTTPAPQTTPSTPSAPTPSTSSGESSAPAATTDSSGGSSGGTPAETVKVPEPVSQPKLVTDILSVSGTFIETIPGASKTIEVVKTYMRTVRTDPKIEQFNTSVFVPASVVISVASVSVSFGLVGYQVFFLIFISQASMLLRRKSGVPFGTVKDKATERPIDLAVVRLTRTTTGRTVTTRVTDKEGRYLLIAPEGEFKVEVNGQNHVPNNIDLKMPDGGTVAEHFALEPIGDTRSLKALEREALIKSLKSGFAFIGPVVAALSFFVTPKAIQGAALLLNIATFLIFLRLSRTPKPQKWGVVYGTDGKPLPHVVVRIVEAQYNKVLDSQLTGVNGRYAFLAGRNRYYVRFEKQGFKTAQTPILDFVTATQTPVIAENQILEPMTGQI